MCTVSCTKSVIYIDFSQTGKSFGEIGIVFLFFGMKTQIFQQENITAFQGFGSCFGFRPDTIAGSRHGFTD